MIHQTWVYVFLFINLFKSVDNDQLFIIQTANKFVFLKNSFFYKQVLNSAYEPSCPSTTQSLSLASKL